MTQAPEASGGSAVVSALRPLVAFLANVTVITALLVYFGWRRSETHAREIGIDESILGMTTREYVLRSVGSVLALLVVIAVSGLVWLAVEPRLRSLLHPAGCTGSSASAGRCQAARYARRVLGLMWLLLPALVVVAGFRWRSPAFVLFPASIAVGVLLWLYLRRLDGRGEPDSPSQEHPLMPVFAGLLVLVCLFWTASNYAEVLGRQLADDFPRTLLRLPEVAVYSDAQLHLSGPGVEEERLGSLASPTYRYSGLRLLEHTGGNYFLVSDRWTRDTGVVLMLRADDESLRFEFGSTSG